MVKQRNRNRNRRRNNTTASQLSKLATGVPVSRRLVSADPPMLPVGQLFSPRIRFVIVQRSEQGESGYKIILPSIPYDMGKIALYFDPKLTWFTRSAALTLNEIFVATAMRVYGVDVTANTGSANYMHTEYAIKKITFYGTDDRARPPPSIRLTADVGTLPGFVGVDSGNANRRAVVCCTFPRLVWLRIEKDNDHGSVGLDIGELPFLGHIPDVTGSSKLSAPAGIVDFSMMMRRSVRFPEHVNRGARKVVFSDEKTIIPAHT